MTAILIVKLDRRIMLWKCDSLKERLKVCLRRVDEGGGRTETQPEAAMQQDPLNTPQPTPEEGSEATRKSPSRESQWLDIVSHPPLPLSPRFDPENETEMVPAMPSSPLLLSPLTLSPAVEPLPTLLPPEPLPLVPMSLIRVLAILALTAIFLIGWQGTAGENSEPSPAASKWIRNH
ncbi:MAG: hypothetical protein OSB12_03095 [Planctomycetota bacterium]|jgi:hypothetical protein|nr:hypothetical protein [Planctomycetota bacterium]